VPKTKKKRRTKSWKQIELRRKVLRNRIARAYTGAILKVFNKFGRNRIPTNKQIEKIMIANVSKTTAIVYKKGFLDGLRDVEEAAGEPLDIIKQIQLRKNTDGKQITVHKEITENDIAELGLPTDIQIAQDVGMVEVTEISEKLRDTLKAVHASALKEGLGVGDIAEAFRTASKKLKDQAAWRARRIAQTETTRIYNAGSLDAYQKSKVATGKTWIANINGNPRQPPESEFNHRAAHKETVPVDKPFKKTGENLQHPGDSAGSVGNVANCECGMQPDVNV
jgi:hypothetical protein